MIVQRQNSAYDRAGSTFTGGMDARFLSYRQIRKGGRRMRSERSRFSLPAVWSALAGAMFVLVLALLTLGQPALSGYYQNLSLAGNLALAPAALAAVSLLLWGRARLEAADARPGGRGALWRMRALFAAVLAVQLVVARCAWYKMGWDIANVYNTAEELARGQALTDPDYFRLCPNNAPLTILQAVPMWVAVKLGLAVPFVVLPYLDAVLLNLTAYFTARCAQRITPSRWARGFAAAVSILWIALSPYVLYPYTDTWAVLFPVLALYAWLTVRRPVLKWGLVSLACFAGAAIKPTVLIVLIALGLLALCRFLGRRDFSADAWKRALAVLAALVLGAVPGQAFQRASTAYLAGSAVPEEQLSETHYLMLGMNGETYGGHSPDDVTFSQSFESLADRQQANLQRAWERICEKGLWGNVRFFTIKLYKAYADGSFAANSSFLDLEIPKRTDALSTFIRTFYHHRGSLNPLCHTLAQGLWLAVLAMCAVAAFTRRRRPEAQVLTLALLGATAYLLLFEVWPRYLFVFAPLYVLLATLALDRPLFARGGEKRQKA